MAFNWTSVLGVLYSVFIYFLFIGMCIGYVDKDYDLVRVCEFVIVMSSTFFYILCMVFN